MTTQMAYLKDSDRGLVPDRGPFSRPRADSTSRADSDRTIPQRGPIFTVGRKHDFHSVSFHGARCDLTNIDVQTKNNK